LVPFEALHLRLNPFGAALPAERGWLAVPTMDIDALVGWLSEPRRAIQLVGDMGRGKSTHLRALHDAFPGAPFTFVPARGPAPPIPEAAVVFVDEAHRLAPAARFRLFRRAASFAVATVGIAGSLWLAGVETITLRVDGLSFDQLEVYVARRMEWAGSGSGAPPRVPTALLRSLRARHGSNMREIERGLYHWLEDLRTEAHAVHQTAH
jgi:hypothetical protein